MAAPTASSPVILMDQNIIKRIPSEHINGNLRAGPVMLYMICGIHSTNNCLPSFEILSG
jgi:hypothetical protein